MHLNEWLPSEIGQDIWKKKYQNNGESLDSFFMRVAGGNKHIIRLMQERKFLPAGRTLANKGVTGRKTTYSNCYYIKAPEDNIEDIYRCAAEIARTLSYGGGVGIDISKLSPAGAKVNNAAKTTSGAVSFMDLFALTTEMIAQNGRRGALMISIECNHPDLIEFIGVKQNNNKVTKANISIKITNDFMEAVKDDKPWDMAYMREASGEIIFKSMPAKKLFRLISESNHMWAEPGLLFWDNIKNWNLLTHNKDYVLGGVNPCAEQSLPDYGSCNLCSVNLSEYIVHPFTSNVKFNYREFRKDVKEIVKYMNIVLDENMELHPLKQQKEVVKNWRPIGIGVMGFAEMLIKMGMPYSSDAIKITTSIAKSLFSYALDGSIDLAKQIGHYPKFNMSGFKEYEYNFINVNTNNKQYEDLKLYGMRNATLLSIAPTGTLSTMLGVSGGIEPLFDTSYTRKTESLHGEDKYYKINVPIVDELILNGGDPSGILTAKNITYQDRILIQGRWQFYVDTAISSTINLPESATVEDIENILIMAHDHKLKGITIYRENCGRVGILVSEEKCTECGGKIKNENGCKTCDSCGWSACSL